MPKITEKRRRAQRERILSATQVCFLRRGIHQSSMQEIIRETGLSAGAVYSYFASKDELILASITASMETVTEAVDALALTENAPKGCLISDLMAISDRLAEIALDTGIDYGRWAMLGLAEAQHSDEMRAHLRESYALLLDRLADLARRHDGVADPVRAARRALVLVFGISAASTLFGADAGFDLRLFDDLDNAPGMV